MDVRLLSYSQPTQEFASMGIDDAQELIAYCARVSNPSNQLNTETSEKLIKYLIKHKHWSPLEMVSACIEIQQQEILQDKSSDTEASASKSLANVTLIQRRILTSYCEMHVNKIRKIDRTA